MAARDKIASEIVEQLQSDILHYGWILQIARDCGAEADEGGASGVVFDVLTKLMSDGVAEVGYAKVNNNMVEVVPWPGTLDEQIDRVRLEIKRLGSRPSPRDTFWVAKKQ
jgi:hypothetical protein